MERYPEFRFSVHFSGWLLDVLCERFPDDMARQQFYQPREIGFEREIAKRLEYWSKLRVKKQGGGE